MNIESVLSHPLFPIIFGALGAILGYVAKSVLDLWTTEVKRRQELGTHVMGQIEKAAPSYYLMSNYAYLLSNALNQYVDTKRQQQIAPISATDSFSPNEYLTNQAKETSKEALFEIGKLYRVITNRFWMEGGAYFLPDKWANSAIEDLHNNLIGVLAFDPNILLKYIKMDTQQHEFYEKLTAAESGVEVLKDLRDEYVRYQEWLFKQDEEVKKAAVYAQAYSDLFHQQMKKLYKDWFDRGLLRRRSPDDPQEADEIRKPSSPLLEETRALIERSAKKRASEKERTHQILGDVTADPEVIDSNRHINIGWNYYVAKQYHLAIEEYQQAKAKQPSNALIYNNLGNAYLSIEDYANAESNYKKALELESTSAPFNANFGRMWYTLEQYDKAAEYYERAVKFDPDDSYYPNDLGNSYYLAGRWDDAIRAYSKAITLSPSDPILYSNLAGAFDRQGSYEAAVGAYGQALNLKSDDPDTWNAKGVALANLGRNEEALEAYDKALSLKNDDPIFLRNRGQLLADLGRNEEALETHDKALNLKSDDPDTWNAKGVALGNLERNEEALEAYNKSLSLKDDDPVFWRNKGIVLANLGRNEEALEAYDHATALRPD